MGRRFTAAGALLLGFIARTAAAEPENLQLDLVALFDQPQPHYLFVIGSVGFASLGALEDYLARLPAGSRLTWAPGCERLGGEPLLSSAADMEAFRAFLVAHAIAFTLIPSG